MLPAERKDAALLSQGAVIRELCNHAFDNNVHLMHTISVSDSFEALLEQARDEKNLSRIRTYLLLFEEYSTYMTRTHKLLTLRFLYELLMHHDGDVRRHAGRIMGAILANSGPRYRKELPRGAGSLAIAPALHAVLSESIALWDDYIELCLHPDYKISQKHATRISNSLKTITASLFARCMPEERRGYWDKLYRRVFFSGGEDLLALMDTLAHVPHDVMQKSEIERMLPILCSRAGSAEARVRIRALRALSAVTAESQSFCFASARAFLSIRKRSWLRSGCSTRCESARTCPSCGARVPDRRNLPQQSQKQHHMDDEARAYRPALRKRA
jgi:hypothetical protein